MTVIFVEAVAYRSNVGLRSGIVRTSETFFLPYDDFFLIVIARKDVRPKKTRYFWSILPQARWIHQGRTADFLPRDAPSRLFARPCPRRLQNDSKDAHFHSEIRSVWRPLAPVSALPYKTSRVKPTSLSQKRKYIFDNFWLDNNQTFSPNRSLLQHNTKMTEVSFQRIENRLFWIVGQN